jgi:hypothetical protein
LTGLQGLEHCLLNRRVFNGGTNAEAQASQAASQAAALSRPHTADARMVSLPTHTHTDPQIPPLSLSPADVPPLFTGLPQRALRENPPFASSQDSLLAPGDNLRALREDSLAALRSRVSWGLGSGQSLGLSADREEGPDEVEGYQGVTVLPGRAGEHIYMAILRELRVTISVSKSQHASSCMLTISALIKLQYTNFVQLLAARLLLEITIIGKYEAMMQHKYT